MTTRMWRNEVARWIGALGLAVAPALWGTAASAQQQQEQMHGQMHEQGAQTGQQQMGGQGTQQQGQSFVQGTVETINARNGSVTVRSGDRSVVLRARPSEISQINQGDSVRLPVQTYGGIQWVAEQGGPQAMTSAYPNTQQVTGPVSRIDKSQGSITVQGRTFSAHPQDLENVQPGQTVSLTYAEVGQVPWATRIQPGQGGSMAQGQQQGQQGQQASGGMQAGGTQG